MSQLLLRVQQQLKLRQKSQSKDNYFRIHVKKLPEENKDAQGLWTWDDVEKPSENWPNGALSFKDAKKMTMAIT